MEVMCKGRFVLVLYDAPTQFWSHRILANQLLGPIRQFSSAESPPAPEPLGWGSPEPPPWCAWHAKAENRENCRPLKLWNCKSDLSKLWDLDRSGNLIILRPKCGGKNGNGIPTTLRTRIQLYIYIYLSIHHCSSMCLFISVHLLIYVSCTNLHNIDYAVPVDLTRKTSHSFSTDSPVLVRSF